jgi:hypothetical protein
MKYTLVIAMLTLSFIGCKKEVISTHDDYLDRVKKGLTDSLAAADFAALEFSRSVKSAVDSASLYILRVPFRGKSTSEDFVVVKTDKAGNIERGKIIHQKGALTDYESDGKVKKRWDGRIVIRSLNGVEELSSPIENGYIVALHQGMAARSQYQASNELPEVVITYTHSFRRSLVADHLDAAWQLFSRLFLG